MMETRLAQLADKEEIRELLHRYCHGCDRVDAEAIQSVFHPDAALDYGSFEGNPAEFAEYAIQFLGATGPTHHNVTNAIISVEGDEASGQSYFIVMHGGIEADGERIDFVVYGRYLDRFERRDGAWRIARRQAIFDWNQHLPCTARWDEGMLAMLHRGRRDRSDPAYDIPGVASPTA